MMHPQPDVRAEQAIYWSAVSLIVCEGLSIDKAAERLGVEDDKLRSILHRRQMRRPHSDEARPKAELIRLFKN
jgi:predicted HTH domain antitoxin